jgi:uncharacterized protein (TIGR03083 family)
MTDQRIQRPEAKVIALEEFRRFATATASLTDDEWSLPTDCTAWDVRKMVLHVLGAADAQASFPQFLHQLVRGVPLYRQIDSHHWVDGVNELQIRERSHLTNDDVVVQLQAIGPKAVAGRWQTPGPMRHLPIPFGPPFGWVGLWYLLDVGFTRDVWAHRIDLCAATGHGMDLSAAHDGRLVADLVGEWAGIHGQPFELVLEGPAGGKFSQGHGGERVDIDAIEFVQILSGRRPGTGVLANPLPL